MEEFKTLSSKLEELGESEVRSRLANGSFGERKLPLVQEWLRSLEASHNSASEAEKSGREERMIANASEANSIARKALSNSNKALAELRSTRIIATSAIILSIIMAIYEVMKYYSIIT